jgi:hypothetical protein
MCSALYPRSQELLLKNKDVESKQASQMTDSHPGQMDTHATRSEACRKLSAVHEPLLD